MGKAKNIRITEVSKKEVREGQKKISKIAKKFSQFNKSYKFIDPRSSERINRKSNQNNIITLLKTNKEKNLKRTQGKKDILRAEKQRLRMTATMQIRRRLSSIQSVILEAHTYQKLSKRKMKSFTEK